jgi:phosphoribosylformylglycinamidine synthase
MISRDQMVGRWQVPVADVAVTVMGLRGVSGEAMAMGERTPVAVLDAPASGRMAVGEALTNVARGATSGRCGRAPVGQLDGGVRRARRGRRAVRHGPRGRDGTLPGARHERSRSARIQPVDAHDVAGRRAIAAPWWRRCRSLIVSAFAAVRGRAPHADARAANRSTRPTRLLLVDLGRAATGSAARCSRRCSMAVGATRRTSTIPRCCARSSRRAGTARRRIGCSPTTTVRTAACAVTLVEMVRVGHCGLEIGALTNRAGRCRGRRSSTRNSVLSCRCVRRRSADRARSLGAPACGACVHEIGRDHQEGDRVRLRARARSILDGRRSGTPEALVDGQHAMQKLRDNPACADEELAARRRSADPGLNVHAQFDPAEDIVAPFIASRRAPAQLRSCASRASTARSRWPRRSIAPASTPSTST